MMMKSGEEWHCTNPACRCQIVVQSGSLAEGSSPSCSCGAPMKKKYCPPRVTYLDFLRLEELPASPEPLRKR